MVRPWSASAVSLYSMVLFPQVYSNVFCSNDVGIATQCQVELWNKLGADQFFSLQRYVSVLIAPLILLVAYIKAEAALATLVREQHTVSMFISITISVQRT